MATEIIIHALPDGAAVSFPFELKDAFRARFRSAKWSAQERRWRVGIRSVKRLEQWACEVRASGLLDAMRDEEEREMGERELARLREELRGLTKRRRELAAGRLDVERIVADAAELRARLEEERTRVGRMRAEAEAAAEAARAERASVEAVVAEAVNLTEVDAALHELRRITPGNARDRAVHERCTAVVGKALMHLAELHVTSDGLRAVATHNYNRFDRDGRPWRDDYTFRVMTDEEVARMEG